MNTEPQENWTKKLEELEKEISNSTSGSESWLNQIKNQFSILPNTGKIIVGFLGLFIALSLISTLFSLVRLAISLAIFSVIIYFGYQFFLARKNQ